MERDKSQIVALEVTIKFNSHTHVERDFGVAVRSLRLFISTHTLTWSVMQLFMLISRMICHFNSHAHVERDAMRCKVLAHAKISTHTLTWSVTRQFRIILYNKT